MVLNVYRVLGESPEEFQRSLLCFHPEFDPVVSLTTRRPEVPRVNPEGVLVDWAWMLVGVTVPKVIPVGVSMLVYAFNVDE